VRLRHGRDDHPHLSEDAVTDAEVGRICHEEHGPPFDGISNVPGLEFGTRERATGIEPAFSARERVREASSQGADL